MVRALKPRESPPSQPSGTRRSPAPAIAPIVLCLVILLLVGCAASPASAPVPAPATGASPTPVGALALGEPCHHTETRPPADRGTPAGQIVRTYQAGSRMFTLVYGRANDRSGDYGWAHIRNKHLYGVWSGGGPLTMFTAIGVCTEAGVQDIIGRALNEGRRHAESGGREVFTWAVPDTRYDVLVVVGTDGTIITAYPARR
jgi:hypothetical protein